MNERGNVFGMMPHPEAASEILLGSADGLYIFRSMAEPLLAYLSTTERVPVEARIF
jgi:phosphoribosylformylglycinamidine (FGAM) synthase-like amidotransferase family enzyme